jgi:hypothetical protein
MDAAGGFMALSPLTIKAAEPQAKPYRKPDGGSLFLLVYPSDANSFEFRYRRNGRLQSIILGGCDRMGR